MGASLEAVMGHGTSSSPMVTGREPFLLSGARTLDAFLPDPCGRSVQPLATF